MNYLLLRGLARNSKHWHGLDKGLSGEVILLDTIGNGTKSDLSSPLQISSHTEILRDEFYKLRKHQEDWTIVGLSLGGMIALDWVSRFPNDFKKSFIINSSTNDVLYPWQRFDLFTFLKLPFLIFSNRANQEKTILSLTLNLKNVNSDLIDSNLAIGEVTTRLNLIKQLISAAFFHSPEKIDIPLYFICSERDRLVNYKASLNLAKKYNSKVFIHPTAGHDIPLDDPNWLLKTILENKE